MIVTDKPNNRRLLLARTAALDARPSYTLSDYWPPSRDCHQSTRRLSHVSRHRCRRTEKGQTGNDVKLRRNNTCYVSRSSPE
uniref:Uncharacterized protein n=1 Tax=Rhizophora mucronata TaxID=61149 RepID=A0A2P2J8U7_RHIMU